ncbi:MAG: hypothetical protein ABFE13_02065 [Phycisphaerales bacterium]
MPITVCFECMLFLGALLLIPILPIALILLGSGRRRVAITLLGLPLGMIALSVLLTVLVLVAMWHYGIRMSRNPAHLFEDTFGFEPAPEIEVLEGYCEPGLDSEMRAMKFRAPAAVLKRMCAGRFAPSNRETFVTACGGEWNNLPSRVRSWLVPAVEQADRFYIANPFDDSFSMHNEAVLCYNEPTGIACFHWVGVD